jgi:hypothetical protein
MSGDGNLDVYDGPALSRHDCVTCGPASLYRGRACIHCGELLKVACITTSGQKKRDWTSRPVGRKRRRKRAAA